MNAISHKLHEAEARHAAGDQGGAIALCREILAEDPAQPDALHIMGAIAHQKGNPDLALQFIEAALSKRLDKALIWLNRSRVLHALGRFEEAVKSATEASRLDPQSAATWNVLGRAMAGLNRVKEAHDCYQCALVINPDNAQYLYDDAMVLYAMKDVRSAYAAMRRALERDNTLIPLTMANILKSAGYPERALPFLQQARAMLPNQPAIALNEAMAHLQMGNYAQGFDCFELRPDYETRFHALPLWDGARVNHLLLHEDQGFGDALQAARYIPMLTQRVSRITLMIAEPLRQLFADNFPMINVIGIEHPIPTVDARIRLMSLPRMFKTRSDTIPTDTPYLMASDAQRKTWHERLAHLPYPRLGIVWGGNTANASDPLRSLSADTVKPLLQEGAKHFVSLQKSQHREEIDPTTYGAFDAAPLLDDFSMTAGLMAELDLIITTCTSTAHLAGALGRPTWLLLSFDPHWTWMLGRENNPWYPSVRLFRQTEPFVWPPVIARVIYEMQRYVAGDQSVLIPPHWNGAALTQNPHALVLPEN